MRFVRAVVFAAAALAPVAAHASTIGVSIETGITADGIIDWGVLGDPLTFVPNGTVINVIGIGGLTATISEPGTAQRRDNYTGNWSGNFGLSEELLWTQGAGPLTLDFSSPVAGAGAQIQSDVFGPFTAFIYAYDSLNNLLGFYTLPGFAAPTTDDSAIFIGILSDSANISRIVFSVPDTSSAEDFAISNVRVQGDAPSVPEPATLTLFGLGLVGAAARARRARRDTV